MRYTNIIDISEMSAVYKNINVRLLYLHMCLKAGYHDYDRDIVDKSIRRLASEVGLTLSATRNAIAILTKYKLLTSDNGVFKVKKWLMDAPITSRKAIAYNEEKAKQNAIKQQIKRQEEDEEQKKQRRKIELLQQGKTEFILYYEELQRKAQEGDDYANTLLSRHRALYERELEVVQQYQQQHKK